MSETPLTPEIDALAELLAEHRDDMETGDYGEVLWSGCTCGDEHPYDQHDRHLADVILRAQRAPLEAALQKVDRTWGGAAMVVKDTVLSILGRRCTNEFCEHDHEAMRALPGTTGGDDRA